MRRVSCAVPATSANLGPGFDSFGIALDFYNKFEAEFADTWTVEVEGEGEKYLFRDERNQVARTMARVFESAGRPELKARIWCANRVPTGNGLGSSSTAIVGGALLARELLVQAGEPRFDDDAIFELVTEIEGHPDNVAPALFGGFTVCWWAEDKPYYARFEPANGLAAVVVPALGELSTRKARAMLPQDVSHKDAAFNVAHAGLLAAALVAGRPELFGSALRDKLHEPYRALAIGDLDAVHSILLEAGADGVALSGAGPTVIGLVAGATYEEAYQNAVRVAAQAADAVRELGTRREPLPLALAHEGSKVTTS